MASEQDHEFAQRLRSTSSWRAGLADDVRSEWHTSASPSLGERDPFARAAARFASELELTAVVYDLVHEGLRPGAAT